MKEIQKRIKPSSFAGIFRQDEPSMPGKRVIMVDVMKGLFIVAMVFSHLHSGFSLHIPWLSPDKWLLKITIFPGLLFAFGYSTYKAYLEKDELPRKHILVTTGKILAAYLLCGVAYLVFQEKSLSLRALLALIKIEFTLNFAEFLLTYAILLVLLLLVPGLFRWLPKHAPVFWGVMVGLVLASMIDYSQVKSVYLALFIGSENATTYPVVQYLPFYLLGTYFAQRKIRFSVPFLVGAIVALAVFLCAREQGLAQRFPPSIYWILGSLGATYLALLFAAILSQWRFFQQPLAYIGKNTLFWLVMSNLIVYSLSTYMQNLVLPVHWTLLILLGAFSSIAYLNKLARK